MKNSKSVSSPPAPRAPQLDTRELERMLYFQAESHTTERAIRELAATALLLLAEVEALRAERGEIVP